MRWQSPLREIDDLFDRTARAFGGAGRDWLTPQEWNPRVDIVEKDDCFTINADLPGVDKDDLSITLEDGVLSIKGERHQEWDDDSGQVHRMECFHGSFHRSFTIPDNVDASALTATAKDGQLVIQLPKKAKEEASEALTIPIG
ncbi:Hsp20/alpha crystallin family protein [Synechococcus sp. RSCCF101]|uniref:Hsp20/alpha crystallin family protein n=1 Tax=Synechococcus sp. RSCCF101 TaxID=2511069 RepID=UPI001CDA49BB|nr:Hsp20/alpha crystallin family protein [Synechococcus sp. RSCCF101]